MFFKGQQSSVQNKRSRKIPLRRKRVVKRRQRRGVRKVVRRQTRGRRRSKRRVFNQTGGAGTGQKRRKSILVPLLAGLGLGGALLAKSFEHGRRKRQRMLKAWRG